MERLDLLWKLKRANFSKDKGKVFTCFSCAGGSTMGYKLAGFDVIGNNEIDEVTNKVYVANHKPKYSFQCDIRDLLHASNLPEDLYNLDILDGSPPCTPFSMAGKRENDWGKVKRFAEGQALQRLDDLFFSFIALTKKLKPKIVIAENVSGLIRGKAKGYVKEILQGFKEAGYKTQVFKLNSATMGIPQTRVRVFFIARRENLSCKPLKLDFKEDVITYREIESKLKHIKLYTLPIQRKQLQLWKQAKQGEALSKYDKKGYYFQHIRLHYDKPLPTVVASGTGNNLFFLHPKVPRPLSIEEYTLASTFPMDFNWLESNYRKKVFYMGMSVPPFMMQRLSNQILLQWGYCFG